MYPEYHPWTGSLLILDHLPEQQHTSRSSLHLYRYHHEPVPANLGRDIPPVIILLFFLFLIMIVLSQILVVHTSHYGSHFSMMQKIQEELKQMDESMEGILHQNILPINKWRFLSHIRIFLYRFEYLFELLNNQSHSTSETFIETKDYFSVKKNLNKSNEISEEENNVWHLLTNTKQIHDQFVELIDNSSNHSFQWKQNYSTNYQRKIYCNEQPSQLSMFERE